MALETLVGGAIDITVVELRWVIMPRRSLEGLRGARAASEGIVFPGGHKPSSAMEDETGSKDLKSIFDSLKPNLIQGTAVVLEDIFKRILGDLGFTDSSFSVTTESLLESISESLLGKHPSSPPESGSVSRIASFLASNIIDTVLDKLHATSQTTYAEFLSQNDSVAGCKEVGPAGNGKPDVPDLVTWTAQLPPSSELMNRVAEEMVRTITVDLELFAIASLIKLRRFQLPAEMKAIGTPRERLLAVMPLCSTQSEATVKADACKANSGKVSFTQKTLQCMEDVISSVLDYILKQTGQNGLLPTRERSVLLHLVNDVLQSFSSEEPESFSLRNSLLGVSFKNSSPPAQSTAGLKMVGELPEVDTQCPTLTTEEMRKLLCPPLNCTGMGIFEEQDKEKAQPSRTFSVTGEQKALVTEETQDKAKYESSDGKSPQKRRTSPESLPKGREVFPGTKEKAKLLSLEKSGLENTEQDAIFASLENELTVTFPAANGQLTKARTCIVYQALKKMEDSFLEEELPLVAEPLQKLLHEFFQHVWVYQSTRPPATPPSFTTPPISRCQEEKQPASKEHVHFNSPTPISNSEVYTLAGSLVKTVFQKLSLAILANPDSSRSGHSGLIIPPLEASTGTEKDVDSAHHRDPAISLERGTSERGPQATAEDLSKGDQLKAPHSLPAKTNLAWDLVEACLEKVRDFVAIKTEPQFCSRMEIQNLLTAADTADTVERDVKTVSPTVTVSEKQPSRFEKVFKVVSRVFLQTSPLKRDTPAVDRQKPAK